MPVFILYFFKVSVCLTVIYLFYYLALRHLTFYAWNRWYLLVGTSLAFLIPVANVMPYLGNPEESSLKIIYFIPAVGNLPEPGSEIANFRIFELADWYNVVAVIISLGMLFRGSKLLIEFYSFFRLRRSATCRQDGHGKIYQVNKNIAPFSFGNAIFLNRNLLQPAELQEIIRHELVHIRQKHTLDLLWLEFVTLLQWFNPFAWLIKQAVKQNLEFIADRAVLSTSEKDKKNYQYLLLKIIGLPNFTFTNQFNVSSLKNRIIMINRKPSSKPELFKFLFALPLMALLLLACRDNSDATLASLAKSDKNQTNAKADVPSPPPPAEAPLAPPPPPTPAPIEQTESTFTWESFFQKNADIKNFSPVLQNNTIVSGVVTLKSGKVENYNFKDKSNLELFRQRYGNIKLENPPPPPPPVIIPKAK